LPGKLLDGGRLIINSTKERSRRLLPSDGTQLVDQCLTNLLPSPLYEYRRSVGQQCCHFLF
jgi:hypothetical protein